MALPIYPRGKAAWSVPLRDFSAPMPPTAGSSALPPLPVAPPFASASASAAAVAAAAAAAADLAFGSAAAATAASAGPDLQYEHEQPCLRVSCSVNSVEQCVMGCL